MRVSKFLLLTAFLLGAAFSLAAQTVPSWNPGELSRKGARIAVNGEKLSKESTLLLLENAGGASLSADWQRYASQRGWGIGLTAGGAVLTAGGFLYTMVMAVGGAVGSGLVAIGGEEAVQQVWKGMEPHMTGGLIVAGVGAASAITGVVLLINGSTHLKRIVKDCNEPGNTAMEISFGATPSGVGLALRF